MKSYRLPVPILGNDPSTSINKVTAPLVKEFIEGICGQKPKVYMKCNRKTREAVGFDIIFHHGNFSRFRNFF